MGVPFADETHGPAACIPRHEGSALVARVASHEAVPSPPIQSHGLCAVQNLDMRSVTATQQYAARFQVRFGRRGETPDPADDFVRYGRKMATVAVPCHPADGERLEHREFLALVVVIRREWAAACVRFERPVSLT